VSGTLTGFLVLVVLFGIIAVAYVVAHRKSGGREPGDPDSVTGDVVERLMTENRKWQAEAAHWKATAERLQRELDQRP